MAVITQFKGDVNEMIKNDHSGLLNCLFGKDRTKTLTKERFMEIQEELMDDVLWLEFTRYSKDGKTISEVDLCNHLLLCANITSKHKRQMVSSSLFVTIRKH